VRSDTSGPRPEEHQSGQGLVVDRTADELITVFGGLLLDPNIGAAATRRFPARVPLTILGQLGVTEAATRMALARQVQRGVLSTARVGRYAYFHITEHGERIFSEQGLRVRGRTPFSTASAVWTLVSFSIPEHRRDQRARLRTHLTERGFRPLRDGLWVALDVHAAEEATRDLDPDLVDSSQLDIFIATPHVSTGLADLVSRVWDLDDLRKRHETFLERWEHANLKRQQALPALTLLAADWVALLEHDPGHTANALGPDWPGQRSAQTATRLFKTLQKPAGTVLRRILTDTVTVPTPST
jgi:phenylacetic acid degradation operon negative regulatory protein